MTESFHLHNIMFNNRGGVMFKSGCETYLIISLFHYFIISLFHLRGIVIKVNSKKMRLYNKIIVVQY